MDQSPFSSSEITSVSHCFPSCSGCLVSHQFFFSILFFLSTKINSFSKSVPSWQHLLKAVLATVFLSSAGLSSSPLASWPALLGCSPRSPERTAASPGPHLHPSRKSEVCGLLSWGLEGKKVMIYFSMRLRREELKLNKVIRYSWIWPKGRAVWPSRNTLAPTLRITKWERQRHPLFHITQWKKIRNLD